MAEAYDVLRSALVSLYRRFAADSEEVQQEWLAFVRRADAALLEALTACVRRSLLEVARALQGGEQRGGGGGGAGGAGAEVSPVFVLNVILDTNGRQVGGAGLLQSQQGMQCAVEQHKQAQYCSSRGHVLPPNKHPALTLHAGWSSSPHCSSFSTRCMPPAPVLWIPWRACHACCQRCWRAAPPLGRCPPASGG